MTTPSKEIDEMMWALADRRDSQANADFVRRHPDLQDELTRRCGIVEQLRGSKIPAPAIIPAFIPPLQPAPFPKVRWIAAGFALASLAIASFTITNNLMAPEPPAPVHYAPTVDAVPFSAEDVPMPSRKKLKAGGNANEVEPKLRNNAVPNTNDKPVELRPAKRPMSIHVERAQLIEVLQDVAHKGGLNLEMPPDMVNPEIRVDYDGISPIEIMADLGKRYGFTAFDEGESHILLIPAVDSSKGVGGFSTFPKEAGSADVP